MCWGAMCKSRVGRHLLRVVEFVSLMTTSALGQGPSFQGAHLERYQGISVAQGFSEYWVV